MNKGVIALVVIVLVVVVATGLWFVMQPAPAKNTTNNTNNSIINQSTNNQSQNNTNTTISAEKAKQLAQQYIGMGVYLGNATLTTYKGIKVWNVSVYTTQGLYTDSIYINAKTGNQVQ